MCVCVWCRTFFQRSGNVGAWGLRSCAVSAGARRYGFGFSVDLFWSLCLFMCRGSTWYWLRLGVMYRGGDYDCQYYRTRFGNHHTCRPEVRSGNRHTLIHICTEQSRVCLWLLALIIASLHRVWRRSQLSRSMPQRPCQDSGAFQTHRPVIAAVTGVATAATYVFFGAVCV